MTEEKKTKKSKSDLKTPTTFDPESWEKRRQAYRDSEQKLSSNKPEIIVQKVEQVVAEKVKPKKSIKETIIKNLKRGLLLSIPIGIILLYWRYKSERK